MFLLTHLLGGHDHAHTCIPSFDQYDQKQVTEETLQAATKNANQEYLLAANSNVPQVKPLLITIEEDDEEYAIRKQISVARDFFTCSQPFYCNPYIYCVPAYIPVSNHLSYTGSSRYIVQRVLRI